MNDNQNTQAKLLKEVAFFLENQQIPYMITGAWSAIYYGRPRASHDIDFVVELKPQDLQKTADVFKKIPEDFLVQPDSIKEAIKDKSMFNIIHLATALKLDFWVLTDEEFDKVRFKRKIKVNILNQIMEMASAEDTIIQKLRWYKLGPIEKHLVDAAFVYQIQRKNLDLKYLEKWIKELNLTKYYQKLDKINLEDYL